MFDTSSQRKDSPVVFVGTYTEPDGSQSEGIYAYRMDSSSGKLTFERVLKGMVNPAFLAIHPQQGFLYAVSELRGFAGQAGGGVSALSINSPSGELSLRNYQFSETENIYTGPIAGTTASSAFSSLRTPEG